MCELTARHGRGTAWARRAMCESAYKVMPKFKNADVIKEINEFRRTVAPRTLCIYSHSTGNIMLCHGSTDGRLWSDPRAVSVALGQVSGCFSPLLPVTVLLLIHYLSIRCPDILAATLARGSVRPFTPLPKITTGDNQSAEFSLSR
jgi:hypothetical protein